MNRIRFLTAALLASYAIQASSAPSRKYVGQPATPRQTQPATPRQTQPATPRQTQPATPRQTQPATPRQTQPAPSPSPPLMVPSRPQPAPPATPPAPPRPHPEPPPHHRPHPERGPHSPSPPPPPAPVSPPSPAPFVWPNDTPPPPPPIVVGNKIIFPQEWQVCDNRVSGGAPKEILLPGHLTDCRVEILQGTIYFLNVLLRRGPQVTVYPVQCYHGEGSVFSIPIDPTVTGIQIQETPGGIYRVLAR